MATAYEAMHELRAAGHKLRDAIPAVYSGYASMSAAGGPRAYESFQEFAAEG